MPGMSAGELCEAPCSFVHAVCVLASDRSRKSHWGVFLAFVCFYDFCRFRRAGMSYRVYPYSLSGGKSIDWLPGVPLAAWGGPGRTQGAVRAAPKTRNYTPTRVKRAGYTHTRVVPNRIKPFIERDCRGSKVRIL